MQMEWLQRLEDCKIKQQTTQNSTNNSIVWLITNSQPKQIEQNSKTKKSHFWIIHNIIQLQKLGCLQNNRTAWHNYSLLCVSVGDGVCIHFACVRADSFFVFKFFVSLTRSLSHSLISFNFWRLIILNAELRVDTFIKARSHINTHTHQPNMQRDR